MKCKTNRLGEQKLAGHTDSKMTDHYKKGYNDWTQIEFVGHDIDALLIDKNIKLESNW